MKIYVKKHLSYFMAVMLNMTAFSAFANDAPDSYQAAMKAYKEEGSNAMLKVLFAESPITDKKAIENINNELGKAESACGAYVNYSIIKRVELTDSAMILYSQLNFEKCPMFIYQVYFKTEKSWVVTQINFDTNPMNIFPHELLNPAK